MARRKGKSKQRKRRRKPVKASGGARALAIALPVAAVAVIGIVAYLVFFTGKPPARPDVSGRTFTPRKIAPKAKSLAELLAMSPAQLAEDRKSVV